MPARLLAVTLVAAFVVGLALSLDAGPPSKLPSVALGSPLILHLIRAAVASALLSGIAIAVVRLWEGNLPTKLSTTGAEWSAPLAAPDREVREQLLRVERESRDAVEKLARRVDQLAGSSEPADQGTGDVDVAMVRWTAALEDATWKDQVADAISALPDEEKLVIALSYYERLTDREIAEVLGTTPAGVHRLRGTALARLRRQLGRDPFNGQS